MSITIGQRSRSISTVAPKSSSLKSRCTIKLISTFLATGNMPSLAIEFIHCDGRELCSRVVLRLILVDFMDGNSGVDDGWLDGLFLDDWLDSLVDVMMNVLSGNGWVGGRRVLDITDGSSILELGLFGSDTLLDVGVVAVLDFAVLNANLVVMMLLWENFTVLNGLYGGVVVVLVDFAVYHCLDILVLLTGYFLILHGRVDSLVDCSVVLSVLGKEIADCCLCLLHGDGVICNWFEVKVEMFYGNRDLYEVEGKKGCGSSLITCSRE